MGIDEKLSKMVSFRENQRIAALENYKAQSKRRLQKAIETKIDTTMIGALAAIESKFGYLWGQGKSTNQLTDRELEMLVLKDALRTDILNNGNNQKRAAVAEINQYDVEWNRHHVDLQVHQKNKDGLNG